MYPLSYGHVNGAELHDTETSRHDERQELYDTLAAWLYERLGFRRTDDADWSHVMRIIRAHLVPPHVD